MNNTYFYGLPRPSGFTLEEVVQALGVARKNQPVQLITYYQLEGKPTRQCSINLKLFEILLHQHGLTHEGEDLLEEDVPAGTRVPLGRRAEPQTLVEEGRVRYDHYRFTEYGKDVVEYYHLQLLAHHEPAEVMSESRPRVRFTKAQLLQSTADVPSPAPAEALLSEAYTSPADEGSQVLAALEAVLHRTWGQVGQELTLARHPSELRIPGLYGQRLDLALTAQGTELTGSVYLLRKEQGLVPYAKLLATHGARESELARLLDPDETLDEAVGQVLTQARGNGADLIA